MSELFRAWTPRRVDAKPETGPETGLDAALISPGGSDPAPSAPASVAADTATVDADIQRWQPRDWQAPVPAGKPEPSRRTVTEADRNEARHQGYEEGLRQGREEAKKLLAQQSQQLQASIAALNNAGGQLAQQLEQELLSLSVSMACNLLRRELSQQPEILLEQIHDAVALLPGLGGTLEVRLSPADVALINRHLTEQGESLEANWQLLEDPSLSPGGFRLSDNTSRLDETLESRLNRLVRQAFADSTWVGPASDDDHDR